MKLDWLAEALRAEGCIVEEHDGWQTRTERPFDRFRPVGLINHHTAGSSVLRNYPDPPFFKNGSLETKCNLTVRPDGVVVCLNAGWALDSGFGDTFVLAAVRGDQPLPKPTDTYSKVSKDEVVPGGTNPGIGGNAHYIDIEASTLAMVTRSSRFSGRR